MRRDDRCRVHLTSDAPPLLPLIAVAANVECCAYVFVIYAFVPGDFFPGTITRCTCHQPVRGMEVFVIGFGVTAGILGYKFWTMKKMTAPCPSSGPVPQNKIRICIAGTYGPHDARAHKIASSIAASHPDKFDIHIRCLITAVL